MRKQETKLQAIRQGMAAAVVAKVRLFTTLLDYMSPAFWRELRKEIELEYKRHHQRTKEVDHVRRTNQLTNNYTYVTHTGMVYWTDEEYTTPVDGVIPVMQQVYEGDNLMMQEEFLYFYGYIEEDDNE